MINWPCKPTNTKYERWYNLLIENAKNRELTEDTYYEKHHIIPKSFGGTNDPSNLVKLLAKEHFIAHMLLWKMKFGKEYHSKMAFAMSMMNTGSKTHKRDKKLNSRMYESLRIELQEEMKSLSKEEIARRFNFVLDENGIPRHREETKKKISESNKGKPKNFTPEHKEWLRQNAMKPKSPETIEKLRIASTGYVKSEETRKKLSASLRVSEKAKLAAERKRGTTLPPERVQKMKERSSTPEARARMSALHKGKVVSEETKEKIRKANVGKVLSPEHREKIRQTQIAKAQANKNTQNNLFSKFFVLK